jgi:hypothetical protein
VDGVRERPAGEKVDLLLIAEGYTAEEMPKFRRDVERLTAKLFELEPFKSRRSDFNVWALGAAIRAQRSESAARR